ncbi:leucine efflux protein LeuE [Streptomyces sp. CMB-StM0423]|uniref:leucine efflux protein LeuE n=1 Tax=Streptomyces sp. CMB-StM0423 TaxID=2059884 RepID=UPI000C70E87F|nr:leucine efflux protein LeuE [Streptomyces sp. CMB-StM0423]AUH43312.1 leucine efflux protein LeuE [Streptomyces sp. CMB-StM0423]
MLGVTDLSTYLAGLALIILLPGPNSLYVVSVAARRGARAGYRAAGGVMCGDMVLMVLSAGGVASLLQASPTAFAVVKFAGAGYLTWLAVGMLRGAWRMWREREARAVARAEGEAVRAEAEREEMERPYRRAFVVSLLNPKAILFFVSFFVQFIDPAYAHPELTFVVLAAWAQLFSITYLTALIFSGTHLAALFRRRRRLTAGMSAAAGTAFLGFAAKLSMSSA